MSTNNISRPSPDDFITAEDNPLWLKSPSPFDTLDNEWYQIIIFYVFHSPASGVSARSKSLDSYDWGTKSKDNDFKLLKKRLIEYSGLTKATFRCEDSWANLKKAFKETDLFEFPTDLTRERIVYRKTKSREIDSMLAHIRNAFAHGRLEFYTCGGDVFAVMEDIGDKKHVSARIIVSKQTLLNWKVIIEAGPFTSEYELEKSLNR